MKSLHHLINGGLILSATLFLFSCTKQMEEPQEDVAATVSSASTDCKPGVLGVLSTFPNNVGSQWRTVMQKWFDGNGKLSNIKANIGTANDVLNPGEFNLAWGTVTYNGNQVYLHDNGNLVLRVTLNGQGKPEASYFYMQSPPHGYAEIDTSYYYYTGDKLTQMVSLRHYPITSYSITYDFYYDAYGNIERVESGNTPGSAVRIRYIYDYSKPNNDMLPYTYISIASKLLEYMDLLRLPMHHELSLFIRGAYAPGYPYDIFAVNLWNHFNYTYSGNMLAQSYQVPQGSFNNTFYTGWECNSTTNADPVSRARTGPIQSLEEFKQRFHD